MIKSKVFVNCIKDLEDFKNSLLYIEGTDSSSEGYNCAIDCVKDSLCTRIDSLKESMKEYDPQDNIDEKCECYNEISSMLSVLNADRKDVRGTEFDKSFEEKIKECIKVLALLLEKYA